MKLSWQLVTASALALSLATGSVFAGTKAQGRKPANAFKLANEKVVREHFTSHVKYPITRDGLVGSCGEMKDLAESDRAYVLKRLPEGTYTSDQDVLAVLRL